MSDEKFNRKKHLKKVHQKRRKETNEKVDKAIKSLLRNNEKINFSKVANRADISRSLLHKRSKLKKRIEKLRKQQEQKKEVFAPSKVAGNIDKENKEAIIKSLKSKIEELKQDKQELKEENKKLRKKLKTEHYPDIYEEI